MRYNMFINICLLVCSTIHVIPFCDGQTIQDMKDLLADKLAGYNTNIRPVANQSEPIELYIDFELLSLIDVDEITQTVTINVMFLLQWTDASMTRTPADYGGIFTTNANNGLFWTPSLVLTTSNEKLKKFGDSWSDVRFDLTGSAYYYPAEICNSACTMDITYFPFDQHVCALQFMPWGLATNEIVFHNMSSNVGKTYFNPNGAWELTDSEISVQVRAGITTDYIVKLFIRRLPIFVIVNVIIPLICLSFLNILVFLIPTDSGERISFCLTLLLSIAVFLTIVSEDLPKISVPMSLFCYYLVGVLLLSACVTIAVLFSLRLYYSEESKPIGIIWKRLVSLLRCQCLKPTCLKRENDDEAIDEYDKNVVKPVTDNETLTEKEHASKENPFLKFRSNKAWQTPNKGYNNKPKLETQDSHSTAKENEIRWKDVSVAFDKVCFVLFSFLLTIGTVTMFGVLVNGSR